METSGGNQKTEAQGIFLYPFTVCASCKLKFVICPFVDEETNKSYPFANGLSGLNLLNRLKGFAHLWKLPRNVLKYKDNFILRGKLSYIFPNHFENVIGWGKIVRIFPSLEYFGK